MLIHILINEPRMLLAIVQRTPVWVWVLLAALIALGVSQCFTRSAGLRRVLLVPIAMTLFSGWGIYSAFGGAAHRGEILALWLALTCAAAALSLWLHRAPPAGTRYDPSSRRFRLPGSAWPMLLIVGIFLVKYVVGVELALQPALAQDSHFAMQIALVYGFINGLFAARAGRLLRLANPKPRHKTSSLPERSTP